MILHLESGYCNSQINTLELNETAAKCHKWQQFIDEEYRDAMLSERDLCEEYQTPTPFQCPQCEDPFSKLSALFQHISSKACVQTLSLGAIKRLVRWLEIRYR
jgi:hypothetical protein